MKFGDIRRLVREVREDDRLSHKHQDGLTELLAYLGTKDNLRGETFFGLIPKNDIELLVERIKAFMHIYDDNVLVCADCQQLAECEEHNADDGKICEACRENYCCCDECDCIVASEEICFAESRERHYCQSCYDEIPTCTDCNAVEELRCENDTGDPICDSCAERYFTCGDCLSIVHENHSSWIEDIDRTVCSDCYEGNYNECVDCGYAYANEALQYREYPSTHNKSDGHYCEDHDPGAYDYALDRMMDFFSERGSMDELPEASEEAPEAASN